MTDRLPITLLESVVKGRFPEVESVLITWEHPLKTRTDNLIVTRGVFATVKLKSGFALNIVLETVAPALIKSVSIHTATELIETVAQFVKRVKGITDESFNL